jgi:modulator of FtsH protease HflC
MSYDASPSLGERIARNPLGYGAIAVALLVLISMIFVVVPETKQALVLRLNKPDRTFNRYHKNERFGSTDAGLKVVIPFVDRVIWVDKQIRDIDMDPQMVLSTDQLRLNVDAYARYRIVDPVKMYRTVNNEDRLTEQLKPILGSALRNELGKRPFAALLSPERNQLMDNIQAGLEKIAIQYGAEIIDVRIKRADLPEGTPLQSAFERMKTARLQEAAAIDADGRKQAQIIQAEADARASQVYAASFGKDPNFYDFYRAMQSYRVTFGSQAKGQTELILSPSNDYLREFRGGR